jgi:O-antigen/teichoic acid export membrane protein
LVVLAKLGDQVMVGTYALGVAFTAPFVAMSLLQLRGVMLTSAARHYAFSDFLALRLSATGAALVLAVGVAWRAGYVGSQMGTIVAVGIGRTLDAICDIYYGRWQAREELERVSKVLFVNGFASVAAVVVALLVSGNVVVAAAATAAGSACALAYAGVSARRADTEPGPAPGAGSRVSRVAALGWLSAPLGVVMAMLTLQSNTPRYFIERDLGVRALALFAAASQLTMAGGNVIAAVATAASPRLAAHRAGRRRGPFWQLLLRLSALGLALGVAGALLSAAAGAWVLSVVYRPEYSVASGVLVWLSLAAGLTYAGSFLGYAMTIVGQVRIQVPLFTAAAAVAAGASWVLVPRWGVTGAAIASGLAAGVQVIGSVIVVQAAKWDTE